MDKNYDVTLSLNGTIVIVPVNAIDEDDSYHEAIHILYNLVNIYVNIDLLSVREVLKETKNVDTKRKLTTLESIEFNIFIDKIGITHKEIYRTILHDF